MSVQFTEDGVVSQLLNQGKLIQFLEKELLEYDRKAGDIQFVFMTDESLLQLNIDFLGHDYYTDIITFDLSPDAGSALDAEIYISVDRVAENAKTFDSQYNEELLRVIFHGILHLLGFQDKTEKEQLEMRKQEEIWIENFYRSLT